jgi:Flp pilus assembly pilin Flp
VGEFLLVRSDLSNLTGRARACRFQFYRFGRTESTTSPRFGDRMGFPLQSEPSLVLRRMTLDKREGIVKHYNRFKMRRKIGVCWTELIVELWRDDEGQNIAEYAIMWTVILLIVVGTFRLIGTRAGLLKRAASAVQ